MKKTEAPGDNIKWLEINFGTKKLGGSNSKDSSLSTKQWAAVGKKKKTPYNISICQCNNNLRGRVGADKLMGKNV